METERLILRRFTPQDAGAVYSIFSDTEVNRFLPWFPLQTMQDALQFYEERLACGNYLAVCMKDDDSPVGYLSIGADDSHDLGYGLCREFWHRGIITEAGMAFTAYLRGIGVPYITATHDAENPRSGAVMRRLGMKYMYSYEELWQPKNVKVLFRMYQLHLDGDEERVFMGYWNNSAHHFIEKTAPDSSDAAAFVSI